ncbi:MAG: LapA family protein [Aquificae bacterium]|nr:LapA family protein [Aquificota bacterium]
MWNKIKLLIWLIILLVVAYFVSMNTQPNVSVKLMPDYQTPEMPLALIIMISVIIGGLLILFFTFADWLNFKVEKVKAKRRIKSLEKELARCQEQLEEKEKEIKTLKQRIEELEKEKEEANKEGEQEEKEE